MKNVIKAVAVSACAAGICLLTACGGCGACLRGCAAGAIHIKEEKAAGTLVVMPKKVVAPGQGE